MKFAWSNVNEFNAAEFVLFGVPDEQGSHSYRKGCSLAPDRIRKISEKREAFERKERTVAQPMTGLLTKRIFDSGNVKREKISEYVEKIVKNKKVPITIGGDHSITTHVLKGLSKVHDKIALIYFDAHPDIICSEKDYYGSVVCDIRTFRAIDFKKSVLIGIREPEPEEFKNIRNFGINALNVFDITDIGIKNTFKKIKKHVGSMPTYLSMDLDVLDPAFAPGVSTPSPGGISSSDLIYLTKCIANEINLIGFDVMEVNPKYDVNDATSHLAAKIIIETISSFK